MTSKQQKVLIISGFIIAGLIAGGFIAFLASNGSKGSETNTNNQQPEIENIALPYAIVDTGQDICYNTSSEITCGADFEGQDAELVINQHSYKDNEDGTVLDNITGLTWQQSADLNEDGEINVGDKLTQSEAVSYCQNLSISNNSDWRLPDIKTLYSLMSFYGTDATTNGENIPFINTDFFDFGYGDTDAGERAIDSQWATTSIYVDKVMGNSEAMFGLNLADGRIKGYPTSGKEYYVKCVSGNESYGVNDFTGNQDGTITDSATNLMWQQDDSQKGMNWESALGYCAELDLGGYSDWRLPNAKELQSIIDYSRSPETTNSAAIDPLFDATSYRNVLGETDWGYYWTNTTHANTSSSNGTNAGYISFGKALGYMNGSWLDVHGAGAQRSDPKVALSTSSISSNQAYQVIDGSTAHGPQGDLLISENYVRCVRGTSGTYDGAKATPSPNSTKTFTISSTSIENNQGATQSGTLESSGTSSQEPPSEATAACASKSDGATCSFSTPDGKTISGSCRIVSTVNLACVP